MRSCEQRWAQDTGTTRLHTRMLPLEGRDCKLPISCSVRHFIPALVLPEGQFRAQQLLARLPPSVMALSTPSG